MHHAYTHIRYTGRTCCLLVVVAGCRSPTKVQLASLGTARHNRTGMDRPPLSPPCSTPRLHYTSRAHRTGTACCSFTPRGAHLPILPPHLQHTGPLLLLWATRRNGRRARRTSCPSSTAGTSPNSMPPWPRSECRERCEGEGVLCVGCRATSTWAYVGVSHFDLPSLALSLLHFSHLPFQPLPALISHPLILPQTQGHAGAQDGPGDRTAGV